MLLNYNTSKYCNSYHSFIIILAFSFHYFMLDIPGTYKPCFWILDSSSLAWAEKNPNLLLMEKSLFKLLNKICNKHFKNSN